MQRHSHLDRRSKFAQPLANFWQAIRQTVDISPCHTPPEPIMTITEDTMTVQDASLRGRNIFLLPLMLAFWCSLFLGAHMALSDKDAFEDTNNYMISLSKKKYGDNYFQTTDNAFAIKMYSWTGDDGKVSWSEYLKYRYYSDDGYSYLILGFALFLLNLFAALFFTYKVLFFPVFPPIFFDRRRQIVYTWHQGTVMGCHFKHLGIGENAFGVKLFMLGEHPTKEDGLYARQIWPTSSALLTQTDVTTYLLAVILKYMAEGPNELLTGQEFHRQTQPIGLIKDKKPADFDTRLEAVLARGDELLAIYEKHGQLKAGFYQVVGEK